MGCGTVLEVIVMEGGEARETAEDPIAAGARSNGALPERFPAFRANAVATAVCDSLAL